MNTDEYSADFADFADGAFHHEGTKGTKQMNHK